MKKLIPAQIINSTKDCTNPMCNCGGTVGEVFPSCCPLQDAPELDEINNVINGLQYIADSPSQEYGGFHPDAIETAKSALKIIKAIVPEIEESKNGYKFKIILL